MNTILTNRHDILLLFEVSTGNPNGDPDAGNMPRQDPFNHGIITDVCLKRKVRNYVENFAPTAVEGVDFKVFIHQGALLNDLIDEALPHAKTSCPKGDTDDVERAALKWLCNRYYDIRAFGAVLSTGNKVFKGSAFGQVRGPIQFTFGRSYDSFIPREVSITRCAATNAKEKKAGEEAVSGDDGSGQNRTMGNKHIVPYALYAAKVYISPAFAEKTGFTCADLDLFFEALLNMFENDRSAARGEMIVRGVYDFEHVGTQHANNVAQNRRESRLGCAHAHKLFDGINVRLKEGREFPQSFADYQIVNNWDPADDVGDKRALPAGVKLHLKHDGRTV